MEKRNTVIYLHEDALGFQAGGRRAHGVWLLSPNHMLYTALYFIARTKNLLDKLPIIWIFRDAVNLLKYNIGPAIDYPFVDLFVATCSDPLRSVAVVNPAGP